MLNFYRHSMHVHEGASATPRLTHSSFVSTNKKKAPTPSLHLHLLSKQLYHAEQWTEQHSGQSTILWRKQTRWSALFQASWAPPLENFNSQNKKALRGSGTNMKIQHEVTRVTGVVTFNEMATEYRKKAFSFHIQKLHLELSSGSPCWKMVLYKLSIFNRLSTSNEL